MDVQYFAASHSVSLSFNTIKSLPEKNGTTGTLIDPPRRTMNDGSKKSSIPPSSSARGVTPCRNMKTVLDVRHMYVVEIYSCPTSSLTPFPWQRLAHVENQKLWKPITVLLDPSTTSSRTTAQIASEAERQMEEVRRVLEQVNLEQERKQSSAQAVALRQDRELQEVCMCSCSLLARVLTPHDSFSP